MRTLPSLEAEDNKVEIIYEGLSVEPIKDGSEILTLQYRGTHPEDCQIILDALMESYENFLEAGQRTIAEDLSKWIREHEGNLGEELRTAEQNYLDFRAQHPQFFLLGEKGETLDQQAMFAVNAERSTLRRELADIESRLEVLRAGYESKLNPLVLLRVAQDGTESSGTAAEGIDRAIAVEDIRIRGQRELRSSDRVVPLLMRLQSLSQRYGGDHPEVKALKKQIAIAERAQLEDANGLEKVEIKDDRVADAAEELEIVVRTLRQKKTLITKKLALLTNEFESAKGEVSSFAQLNNENTTKFESLERLRRRYDEITAKVGDVELLVTSGGKKKVNFQRMQYAAEGLRVEPSLAKSLAAGTMLGFLAGFGLGYLVEMFDKTFRSPQEVSKVLQLPMIGHIPEITCQKPEDSALTDVLVTAHKPKSPLAENFRAIRTALYFSTAGQQNRVIQTTSPVPGDGKSTLTANIAVTIAQSNKSVLLIDADFRRPTQHKLFGVGNEQGLASVVTGEMEPDAAVQTTEVPNLHLMSCGPRPHNPSELLTSPQFADLLEVVREQYDFVLIDTPPVLAVTDPGIVSARVDGVIMCLRIRKNGRPSAVRARKVLHDLDANMLGIVVNGIDHRSGSYGYYSSYRRGYGYNYAYKYGYGYGMDKTEKAINKYFEEPKPGADQLQPGTKVPTTEQPPLGK